MTSAQTDEIARLMGEVDRLTRERDRELEHSHALTQNWANALEEIDRLRAALKWYQDNKNCNTLDAGLLARETLMSVREATAVPGVLRGEK